MPTRSRRRSAAGSIRPSRATKLQRADLVDVESGQRIVLAVALDRLVVDVVVAEAAEVEVRDVGLLRSPLATPRRCAARSTSWRAAAGTRSRASRAAAGTSRPASRCPVSSDRFQVTPFSSSTAPIDRRTSVYCSPASRSSGAGEGRLDVLRRRQRVDLVVVRDVEDVSVEPARLVVDQEPVVAELRRIALAASLRRDRRGRRSPTGSTTSSALPEKIAADDVDVAALVCSGRLVVRRVRGGDAEAREPERDPRR